MLILQINTLFFIREKKSIKCSETTLIKVWIFQLVINLIQLSLSEPINLYFPSRSTFFTKVVLESSALSKLGSLEGYIFF